MKRKSCNRRQFLKSTAAFSALGFSADPMRILTEGFLSGLMGKSAQAAGAAPPKRYVSILLPNAPNRVGFDQFLKGYNASEPLGINRGLINSFSLQKNSQGIPGTYETVGIAAAGGRTLQAPVLWNSIIPTGTSGTANLSSLLSSMLSIQGIKLPGDGHAINENLALAPAAGQPSIDGLVGAFAAKSSAPPAVSSIGYTVFSSYFKSPDGSAMRRIYNSPTATATNPAYISLNGNPQANLSDFIKPVIQAIDLSSNASLAPGVNAKADFLTRKQAISGAISQALDQMKAMAQADSAGADTLWNAKGRADQWLDRDLSFLQTAYINASNRYRALQVRAYQMGVVSGEIKGFSTNVPKPTDFPTSTVPRTVGGLTTNVSVRKDLYIGAADASGFPLFLEGNSNLSSIFTSAPNLAMFNLADNFAAIEVLLLNNITRSISMSTGFHAFYKLKCEVASVVGGATELKEITWENDSHDQGCVLDSYIQTVYFYIFSSLLNELVTALRSGGIYDETLIHLCSEFTRSPRKDGSGSDHNLNGNAVTLFGGGISGPALVGAVKTTSDTDPYPGAQGVAAKVDGLDGGNHEVGMGNVGSTICQILGVPTPSPNFGSLTNSVGAPYAGYEFKYK